MEKARFTFLFQRYLEQTCNEQERSELMAMIESSAYDEHLKSLMDEWWQQPTSENRLTQPRAETILQNILKHQSASVPIRKQVMLISFYKVAAAVALLVLSAGLMFYLTNGTESHTTEVAVQVEVPMDEHQLVKLADGSTVILNAGSKLEYPDSFNDKATREVYLTGEGYFDIKPNADKPFIVHTGKLKTTVLGTAFNIKAYPQDKSITVTVTRGKVKVSDEKKVIGIITPNQQITFNENKSESAQEDVDSRHAIAWAERDVFFDDVTLGEAADQLEERFNVNVHFINQRLKECRFTATFVKGETLEQILIVICEFNNATYNYRDDGSLEISGEGC